MAAGYRIQAVDAPPMFSVALFMGRAAMRCVPKGMLGTAIAVALAFAMPQLAQAQFGMNSGSGQNNGGFGFSFGNNGRGGSGFSININPGTSGGRQGSRHYGGQQSPGWNLNRQQAPGLNLNTPSNGFSGLGGNSSWSNWGNRPSYRPSYQPSYRPSYSPSASVYAQSAPVQVASPTATLPRPPAEPILLLNPKDTGTPVHYKVNEYPYIMGAGQTQQLGGHAAWTIDFHRGGSYGRKQYSLDPGKTYRFTPTTNGWELYVVNPPVPPVPSFLGE
jgi:hypothetical protein